MDLSNYSNPVSELNESFDKCNIVEIEIKPNDAIT